MNTDGPAGSAPEDSDAVAVRGGRRGSTYTDVHDWVTFSAVAPEAKALYVVLRAHVNRSRNDDLVWTSTLALARMLSYSRGDKITRFIKELSGIGAIEAKRSGLHGRLEFTVNQEPDTDYAGPRTAAEWHAANKAELTRLRAEEKAKRDARRNRATPRNGQVGSSGAVHPEQGEEAVHPERGVPVTPESGVPVHPVSGREPNVLEPAVTEPSSVPASQVRPGVAEAAQTSDGQITIDGEVDPPAKEREITNKDVANEIARNWFAYWAHAARNTPIGGAKPHVLQQRMVNSVLGFLESGYSRKEIGKALQAFGEPDIPRTQRLQQLLAAGRGHRPPGQQRRGARVNDHWNQPVMAGAGAATADDGYVPPKAAAIRTERPTW